MFMVVATHFTDGRIRVSVLLVTENFGKAVYTAQTAEEHGYEFLSYEPGSIANQVVVYQVPREFVCPRSHVQYRYDAPIVYGAPAVYLCTKHTTTWVGTWFDQQLRQSYDGPVLTF